MKDAFTWMFPAASALYLLWVLGSVAAQRLWGGSFDDFVS